MLNPSNSDHIKSLEVIQAAGQKRSITILRADARNPQEIETVFSLIVQQNASALLLFTEGFFQQRKSQIAELTAKHRLPSITQNPEFAEAGPADKVIKRRPARLLSLDFRPDLMGRQAAASGHPLLRLFF